MRVLGLDISTVATGWAIIDNGKLLKHGVIKIDADLNDCEKYFYVTQSVATLLKIYKPNELAIEDTFFLKNVNSLKVLNRVAGQIMYVWYVVSRTEPYFYMAVSARKAIPDLKGNAQKDEVTMAVNKTFKKGNMRQITDHNEADAVVMAIHHYLQRQPEVTSDKQVPDTKKASKKRRL